MQVKKCKRMFVWSNEAKVAQEYLRAVEDSHAKKILLTSMALNPRAPVFFSNACLAINFNAPGLRFSST